MGEREGSPVTALGIVAFVVALLVSVVLHEAGHFATAKAFGMKATQFFVGFGPTLWSRRKGETEYGVKAIPAGGFVKIIGMTPVEEVAPGDAPRAFFRQPAGRKAVVLSAGSFMHFVLALVIFYAVALFAGIPQVSQTTIGNVADCVPRSVSADCTAQDRPSPAKLAGLQAGDEVVSLDGRPVTDWAAFAKALRAHGPGDVTLVVRRGGQQLPPKTIFLAPMWRDVASGGAGDDLAGYLGVGQGVGTVTYNPVSAVGGAGRLIGQQVHGTYDALTSKLSSISKLYSHDRDPAGFVGVVGAARVSGDVFSDQRETFSDKVVNFVMIVGSLNIFVGIFNLLPLLPLDGGHLAIVGYESGRHRFTRRRRERALVHAGLAPVLAHEQALTTPVRRVDYNKVMPVAAAFVAVLVVFVVYVLGADIVNPIRINQ